MWSVLLVRCVELEYTKCKTLSQYVQATLGMESVSKKGRPKMYDQKVEGRRGAPSVTVRFSPDVHERVTSQPDGARVYLEALVREDIRRSCSTADAPVE